ncbi:MAG: DUF4258 domain-containing protein [candidate division NC10 bacterium]|nr:DUF4258 domain-containing protein [candidate division NC10 bacterium]
MSYVLTEHARDALRKRQIEVAWMEQALNAPEVTETDPVDPALEHRLARISEFRDRVLRVIINAKRTPSHVVTVFFDRRRIIP